MNGQKIFIALATLISTLGVADPASIHGMLLFGKSHQYVSHLPMFHLPHDYQAIAEVALTPQGKAAYLKDAGEQPKDMIYTIVPELFSLPDKFQEGKTFKATVVRGHFEKGGKALLGTQVTIVKVLLFKKLHHDEAKPSAQPLLLFGNESETFAAHFIGGAPDFDQVSLLTHVDLPFNPMLAKSDVPNDTPMKDGQMVIYNPGTRLAGDFSVLQSMYLEFDDLAG